MTAARGSRFAEMVAVAMEILDRDGLDAFTMRNVADRLGIREASLYKHCGGRDDLLAGVAAQGVARMAEGRRRAVAAASEPADAVRRMAIEHRAFARRHPHLYRLTFDRPFPADAGVGAQEARARQPVAGVLRSEELTWAAFAFTHGMLELERTGRLSPGPQLEAVWEIGIQLFGGSARDPSALARVGALERDLRVHGDFIETVRTLMAALPAPPADDPAPSEPPSSEPARSEEITHASP